MALRRAKICQFCKDKINELDYKDIGRIRRLVSARGKILSSKLTGSCSRHQRMVTLTVKRARFAALLPFISA